MDNICHTFVGAVLARTGLDKRTPLAMATMMIGANFPDIDVIAVPLGTDLGFRRGITHGVAAQIILPFVLTAIMIGWDKWVRRRKDPSLAPVVPGELLLLSAIAIVTHPFLDWCNSYGMRWLMPMTGEWFYGDSLFIVEPFMWVVLFIGSLAGRYSRHISRAALVLSTAYIVVMMVVTSEGRRFIESKTGRANYAARELMVAPVALKPFDRQVVLATDTAYLVGRWNWHTPFTWETSIPINRDDPAVARALADPATRAFMDWSRFPFFIVNRGADGATTVHIADARYTDRFGGGWASITVPVTP